MKHKIAINILTSLHVIKHNGPQHVLRTYLIERHMILDNNDNDK